MTKPGRLWALSGLDACWNPMTLYFRTLRDALPRVSELYRPRLRWMGPKLPKDAPGIAVRWSRLR